MRTTSRWAQLAVSVAAVVLLSAPAFAACPGHPNALGVARTVEIDTKGGPGFGFEHFKDHDFLREKEVVLTFDDGPWTSTPDVLTALSAHCTKAIFFVIGKHATYYPAILKRVAAEGHTIGTHTWSHADLSSKKLDEAARKAEIEMGISAARHSLGEEGDKLAAFFRFPALRHPGDMMKYAGSRNLAVWSTDVDSFDFKLHSPDRLVAGIMKKLEKSGKGILLMHDFQKHTAKALPDLLAKLKAGGFKIVEVRASQTVKALPEYDALVAAQTKGPSSANARPTSLVVKTISEPGK